MSTRSPVVDAIVLVVVPVLAATATSFAAIAIHDAVWGPVDGVRTQSVIGGTTAFVTWLAVTLLVLRRISPVKPGETWPYLPERSPKHPSDAWARGLGWPDVSTGGADVRSSAIHDPRDDEAPEPPTLAR